MGSGREKRRRTPVALATTVAVLALALGLAACGSGGGGEGGTVKLEGEPSGKLTISNWPLYIDPARKAPSPTSKRRPGSTSSTSKTSTTTPNSSARCSRCSNRANRAGAASSSSPTGWRTRCTNSATCRTSTSRASRTSRRTWCPRSGTRPSTRTATFSVPWQSGMGGLIVRTDLAPEVHSICDLFDSKYKGKVDFLSEMRETVPLVMTCAGREPRRSDRRRLDERDRKDQGRGANRARSAASPATTTRAT